MKTQKVDSQLLLNCNKKQTTTKLKRNAEFRAKSKGLCIPACRQAGL